MSKGQHKKLTPEMAATASEKVKRFIMFKQWGEWVCDSQHGLSASGVRCKRFSDGTLVERIGKKAAGRLLDGRTWDEVPE